MCKVSIILTGESNPAKFCREHVYKVEAPCEHYDKQQEFCQTIYLDYCSRQGGNDPPCAYCYLRQRDIFDPFAAELIFIKARAGSGRATWEECRQTGFWEHAVQGQLIFEQFTEVAGWKRKLAVPDKKRYLEFSEAESMRKALRLELRKKG